MTSLFARRLTRAAMAATVLTALACRASAPASATSGRTTPPNARGANAAPMLVSTAWVAEHAADRDLVILHVGTKAQYDSSHVAGSRHVSLDDIALPQQPGSLTLQMAGTEQLTAWAVRNGIGDGTRVIVVPHDLNLQSATRVFFTLSYLGAGDRTSLMDGGFQAWKGEQRAVSSSAPAAAPSVTFTPRVRPELIALVGQVETATQDKSRHIVDARLTRFYNGDGGGYPRPGHIPTAVNIPISSVSVNGFFRPRAELEALFMAQQVDRSKPVITYCHIGQQATLLWFVATLLQRDARMYDGSFQEWSGSTRPIVAPGGK
ncbi:MAG: sulfurtransferase [Gemmatimonas sp.]|uniref:sulfurtransferase n=1 Tax=Gemmatimonas sp. TaxID=1962908 RepID=UPI00391D04B9